MNITAGEIFGGNITISIQKAAHILGTYPASARAFLRIARQLKHSEKLRNKNTAQGVMVPPLLIVSTTGDCNLTCSGCYACAQNRDTQTELNPGRIRELMDEAAHLGVSIVMLAGGEPLLSRGWLDALGEHGELLGIVFTNGTLLDEAALSWFDTHRHILPAISIEGTEQQTDARRGAGVYQKASEAMQKLLARGIPYGLSLTVTAHNIDTVLREDFITGHIQNGCRLFVFVEYVPAALDTRPLVLSKENKRRLNAYCLQAAQRHPALFVPFPGDEGEYGGCLAAGRGFIHVSANGDVEPCPFAPFSDCSLAHTGLKEALNSKLLASVREQHHLLKEGEGGCALWNNKEWLQGLMENG